jgi:hypothetical protein
MFAKLCSLAALALTLTAVAQVRFPARITGADTRELLEFADLTCNKVFLSPEWATTGAIAFQPTTYRYDGATRQFFILNGQDGHLLSFTEPTGSACNTTPISSIDAADWDAWNTDGDWGALTVSNETGEVPGTGSAHFYALRYDPVTEWMIPSWLTNYSGGDTYTNTFAAFTLNDGAHTVTRVGCWGFDTIQQWWAGSGVVIIPDWFVSAYLPAGRRFGIGLGGHVTSQGNSFGPTINAVAQPTGNACATDTDYAISAGTWLARYEQNNVGPHCALDTGPGCNPSTVAVAPYPAKTLFNDYSYDLYDFTYEPRLGTENGWWGAESLPVLDWYDDGVRHGVIVPFTMPSGWINTTVSASPAPSYNTGTGVGEMTLPTIDMNDGSNINVGDVLWVKTCTEALDGANCEEPPNVSEQLNFMSEAYVTAIDTGTKRVTYQILSTDSGDGTSGHVPVVGGPVWMGCQYKGGSPGCSRNTLRAQIYNPAQYAEVIASTRNVYDVIYAEEVDFTQEIHHFGSPATGSGMIGSKRGGCCGNEQANVAGVMADPDAHQIIIAMRGARNIGGGTTQSLYYVFDVSQAPPAPIPFPVMPLAAGVALWGVGRLATTRRAA